MEGLFGTGGEEVAAEEEGVGVEAVVAAEEADGCEEREDGVVAGGVVGGGPGGVVVSGGELGEGVYVFPGKGRELGEVEGGRDVLDGSGEYAVHVLGAGDGLVIEN